MFDGTVRFIAKTVCAFMKELYGYHVNQEYY